MTTNEIRDYYAKLLILQYVNKPKAYAMMQALVLPVIMDQLPVDVQNAFNVDTAVGVQLDILGDYVGVTRSGYDLTGPITLDDSDFRQLIKFAIIKNNSASTLAEIQSLLNQFFDGAFLVFDYKNMQMDYFFNSSIGSIQLAEMVAIQGLLPKPMAVLVGALIYAPDIKNFFGFGSYPTPPYNVYGFNSYSDYQTDAPWLSYADAIIIP